MPKTRPWAGQPGFMAGAVMGFFSLPPCPVSYRMGRLSSFPEDKVVGTWNWPLSSIWYRNQEYVELYLHSPIHLRGGALK